MSQTSRQVAQKVVQRSVEQATPRSNRRDTSSRLLVHEGVETVRGLRGFYPFFDRMQASFSDILL